MKKTLVALTAVVALLLVFGCVSTPERDPNTEYALTILHTNDHHGAILSKDDKGGLAERATLIKGVRADIENVLLLDAGDINTGPALSNMFAAEPDIKGYNLLGYDAVTFGNHEFDGTHEKLLNQIEMSEFEWISSNITEGNDYIVEPYIIKNYDGFRVGVFGLTTNRTQVIASPDDNLAFIDEVEAAREMVDILTNKELCDIVIAVGHIGDIPESSEHSTSLKIANEVDGIDIFIDGHSQSYFAEPIIENGTIIVSANEWGKFVGQMDLVIKNGEIISYDWMPIEVTTAAFAPDAEMVAMLKPYVDKADKSLKDVVMVTSEEFVFGDRLSRKQEIALGNLVSDAQVAYLAGTGVMVDFGFTNGGNIRTNLPAGEVTREDIMTLLPFENYVYVVTLKGTDLIELFEFIGSVPQGAGAWAQMSKEARYTITIDENGGKVSDVTISGEPIDPDRMYQIAVNNYLATGGDGYEVLTKAVESYNTSILMSDVVVEYAKTLPQPIAPITDGRITVIGGMDLN